jgi:serine/threonine protein kinase
MGNECQESEFESGEVIACRYRVAAHYRTHPLGELYCCYDESRGTDSNVLLQRLRREFALPGVQDRLFETRGSASLESPVIADILDYGEDIDGRPFLVTPWSDDASLDAVERPLGFVEAVEIVIRVAEALAPLHAQGMLHGGIEPASVLVDDQREVTGLLGFGLAPALAGAADHTRALPRLVSPAYAAPELITGQPLGPHSDVYALGILLWELLFGQMPFRGAHLRVFDAHLNRPLPDFELPFDAPASFAPTLRRMLAKRPEDRFADAAEVAEQLREHLLEANIEFLDPADVEEDAETVIFRPVRERAGVVPMQPRQHPESELVHAARSPSQMLPKLAVALAICVSVMLLSVLAIGSHRTQATERSNGDAEHVHASASWIGSSAVEAVSLVRQPPAPTPIEAAQPPPAEHPESTQLRKYLRANQFRAHKDDLTAAIERVCTQPGVRRTVKLEVHVDGGGRVETAKVLGELESKLGRCIERHARDVAFPVTRKGGSYTYTLRLAPGATF